MLFSVDVIKGKPLKSWEINPDEPSGHYYQAKKITTSATLDLKYN